MSYKIITDSSANLPDAMYDALDVGVVSLGFTENEQTHISYVKGQKSDLKKYYTMLREGKTIQTNCVNQQTYYDFFDNALKNDDVLYLGFSSGLSASYNNSVTAINELRAKYPDRKIYAIDTLAASMGEGMLVYYAANLQKQGKPIDEVRDWVESNKLRLCHWFTVEDLKYLYRGGRVSKLGFILGKITQIKPVLHTDNEGHLTPVSKVIGRRKSIEALAEKVAELIENPEDQTIFISHGDSIEDAQKLAAQTAQRVKVKGFEINYVDPVIGCHSGPGTLAIFFLGRHR